MQNTILLSPFEYYKQHRKVILSLGACMLAQFVVFKILYPHPNFMPDSYGYLGAARNNDAVSNWPIGYSMFLRFESIFTRSDIVLVFIQYFFLQACVLYFLFGLSQCLNVSKKSTYVLAYVFAFNPASLLISNYVAADAIFTALSLLWFCVLLALLLQPDIRLMIWLGVLVFILFTIRYNALYYPIISFFILLISKTSWRQKLLSGGLMFILLAGFVGHNIFSYKRLTNQVQFSPFGGWMLAGDALFMYSKIPRDKGPVPARFSNLHQLVNKHMDSLDHAKHRPDSTMGIYYIWQGPLLSYMQKKFSKDSTTPYLNKWASVAPLYQSYGAFLIKRHPKAYAEFFLLPNAGYYFSPPAEFLSIYNQGKDSVGRAARDWFGYKNRHVASFSKNLSWVQYLSVVNTLINIVFYAGLLGFLLLGGWVFVTPVYKKAIWLSLVITVFNFAFSVLLAPIVLRYQLFSFSLNGFFSVLFISVIISIGKYEENKKKQKVEFISKPATL